MVGTVFDDFRAFQTAFKAFQDETNQLFVVKKSSKSVDAVNKKLYNSVILLYFSDFKQHPTQQTHPPHYRVCSLNEIEPYLNYLYK